MTDAVLNDLREGLEKGVQKASLIVKKPLKAIEVPRTKILTKGVSDSVLKQLRKSRVSKNKALEK